MAGEEVKPIMEVDKKMAWVKKNPILLRVSLGMGALIEVVKLL